MSGVVVEFTNGSIERADMLLGCDGINSKTRSLLFGPEERRYTGVLAVIGLVKLENSTFKPDTTIMYQGKGKQVGIYGIRPNEILWFCGEKANRHDTTESWLTQTDDVIVMAKKMSQEMHSWGLEKPMADLVKESYRVIRYPIYDRVPTHKVLEQRECYLGWRCCSSHATSSWSRRKHCIGRCWYFI